jgi:hypothetical protein
VTHEEILAWTHLSGAGFINGSYTMANGAVSLPDDDNTPKNVYGVYVELITDSNWGQAGNTFKKTNVKTGSQVPVEILAEVDRKIDDGMPYTGTFQFSPYVANPGPSTIPNAATCTSSGAWNIGGGDTNCGAASTF